MSKSLLPALLGGAAILGTGGLAAPAIGAGAAGGTAAMGGAMAGDALASAGAAGLLGGAGATAAGYGAGAGAMGLGAAGDAIASSGGEAFLGAGAGSAEPLQAGQGLMGNGMVGNTIEADGLTANAYTGGYDSLNGIERMGQRIGGFMDDGGLDKLGKFKNAFGGQQEQPQQPQDKVISGGAVQGGQEPSQMGSYVYGQPSIQELERQRRILMNGGGYFG